MHRRLQQRARWFLALRLATAWFLVLPLATACSFLLDFNKLQKGSVDAGTSGASGHGGSHSGGTGGTDGSVSNLMDAALDAAAGGRDASDASADSALPCPMPCDDHDPCTTDLCVDGQCVSTASAGIVEDGFSQTLNGDNIYRASLVAGANRFYLATYGNFAAGDAATKQDIALYSIPATGSTWAQGPQALSLKNFGSDVVISPAALVWNDAASELISYFAVGPTSPANFVNAGQIQRAELSADLQPVTIAAASADSNYRYLNNTLGPAASHIPGGEDFVAWTGAPPATGALGAGIYVQTGSTPLAAAATPDIWAPQEITGLATIYGLGGNGTPGQPGVVWMTQRANAAQVDTHLQLLGNALSQTFGQCLNSGVQGISVVTGRAHLDGFWFTGWTKQHGPDFETEMTPIVCTDPQTCLFNATCGDQQAQLPTLRNPKITYYHRLSDSSKVTHQALVASVVDNSANKTSIVLLVQRFSLDNSDAGSTTTQIGSLTLAEAGATQGPDWPELAMIEPDKLAVSWIEYGPSKDTLHVGRYRVCYGD
jgi:hypothetical protein